MMKTRMFMALLAMAAVMTACSDDVSNGGEKTDDAAKRIVRIDYKNTLCKTFDTFSYDEKRRISHIERNDSNDEYFSVTSYMAGYHREVVTHKQVSDYKYNDADKTIEITTTITIGDINKQLMNATTTVRNHREIIYTDGNRIDSIYHYAEYLSGEDLYCLYKYYLEYDSENKLTHIKEETWNEHPNRKGLFMFARKYDYNITWNNGDIVSYDYLQGSRQSTMQLTYNEKKGFLPTLNFFTLIFGSNEGLLAQQGYFGKLPEHYLATYRPSKASIWNFPVDNEDSVTNPYIDKAEYVFEGNTVKSCTILTAATDYNYVPFQNMTITWE